MSLSKSYPFVVQTLGKVRKSIVGNMLVVSAITDHDFERVPLKGAGTFHSASQSKEGSVGFGTSQHPIFMKLLPDHLWH